MQKHEDQGGSGAKGSTLAQELREAEARDWLRRGYRDRASIEELKEKLRRHRSEDSINTLLEEMRRQWSRRREWEQSQ